LKSNDFFFLSAITSFENANLFIYLFLIIKIKKKKKKPPPQKKKKTKKKKTTPPTSHVVTLI
jgi:hypothetical protein